MSRFYTGLDTLRVKLHEGVGLLLSTEHVGTCELLRFSPLGLHSCRIGCGVTGSSDPTFRRNVLLLIIKGHGIR